MLNDLLRTQKFISHHPLAQKRSWYAWKNWLRWQLGARLLRAPVVMPWIDDSVLVVEPGMTGATGNLYCGLHEFADMALLLHYFSGADSKECFFDIGANVGSYTILASKVCGARTVAFEPVPSTFTQLDRNCRVNHLEDLVTLHRAAVGATDGTIRFSTDRGPVNQVVDNEYKGKSSEVPVIALDNCVEGSRVASFWKIDVEGFEEAALTGAAKSLQDPNVQIVLLEGTTKMITSAMASAGFGTYLYDPFTRDLRRSEEVGFHGNHVWIRDVELVSSRCKNASSRKIFGETI